MNKKKTVCYILMYLPLVVILIVLPHLPEKIPVHYGFDNQVDRWGSKYVALLFPVVSILMGYFLLGMAKLAAKKEEHGENNKNVTIIVGILVLISFVSLDIGQLVFGIIGMLMIVTGNLMPKLRMNSMIGLRTYWSMKNEATWKKSQHIGGISFIIGGIIIIGICIVMKGTPCLLSVLGVWGMLIVIDIFLTYRVAAKN